MSFSPSSLRTEQYLSAIGRLTLLITAGRKERVDSYSIYREKNADKEHSRLECDTVASLDRMSKSIKHTGPLTRAICH